MSKTTVLLSAIFLSFLTPILAVQKSTQHLDSENPALFQAMIEKIDEAEVLADRWILKAPAYYFSKRMDATIPEIGNHYRNLLHAVSSKIDSGVQTRKGIAGYISAQSYFSDQDIEQVINEIPLKRKGEASDITEAICYLVEAPYVNGQILSVDGGRCISASMGA